MRKHVLFTAVTLGVIVLDLGTKALVMARIPRGARIPVVDGLFQLVHVRNPGGAFGMMAGLSDRFREPFFLLLSGFAVALVLSMVRRTPEGRWGSVTALGLVLGGAMGNLVDRIRLGEVVDFLDVYWGRYHWPAFNVADIAIVIGVGLVLIDVVREPAAEPLDEPGGEAPRDGAVPAGTDPGERTHGSVEPPREEGGGATAATDGTG